MTMPLLLCANGPHPLPQHQTVLLHNTAPEVEPARFICHPCWCIGTNGHAPTPRTKDTHP